MDDDLYTITGTVVTGEHLGEKLGYPTANLDSKKLATQLENIPRGVYAGFVDRESNGSSYKAGIIVGARDSHNPPKVEAHLIDLCDDLYGETLTFHFSKFIRNIIDFDDNGDLVKQIEKDLTQVNNLNK